MYRDLRKRVKQFEKSENENKSTDLILFVPQLNKLIVSICISEAKRLCLNSNPKGKYNGVQFEFIALEIMEHNEYGLEENLEDLAAIYEYRSNRIWPKSEATP